MGKTLALLLQIVALIGVTVSVYGFIVEGRHKRELAEVRSAFSLDIRELGRKLDGIGTNDKGLVEAIIHLTETLGNIAEARLANGLDGLRKATDIQISLMKVWSTVADQPESTQTIYREGILDNFHKYTREIESAAGSWKSWVENISKLSEALLKDAKKKRAAAANELAELRKKVNAKNPQGAFQGRPPTPEGLKQEEERKAQINRDIQSKNKESTALEQMEKRLESLINSIKELEHSLPQSQLGRP